MNEKLPKKAALLIIDVQNAIDDPQWAKYGKRNHVTAEGNMSIYTYGMATNRTKGDSC